MGTISIINCSNLFWLGRYTERVFTTLNTFFKYFDLMIDVDENSYVKYLDALSIPNIYTDDRDFYDRYLFDKHDPNSVRSNFERALDNGVVLRMEIRSSSLSYLQMALDMYKKCVGTEKIRYDLLPIRDEIYAFWGSIDNNMTDLDAKKIIYVGKAVERLDLFLRFKYPYEDVRKEYDYLADRLSGAIDENGGSTVLNMSSWHGLEEVINRGADWTACRNEALYCLERLFEVKKDEALTV